MASIKFGEYYHKDLYLSVNNEKDDLIRCKQCYDDMIEVKEELININIDNKIYAKVIPEMEMISKEQNKVAKKKYEDDIRILALNIGNKIEQINQQNELKRLEFGEKIELLDAEINNLKIKIEKLKEQSENDIDLQKKKKLNEIKNYFKFKLVKYQNEKLKEIEKAKALNAIKKKNFEVQKELEINDMKNKSLLIQELIAIFKTNDIINS
jgi:hypothetical protein